MKSKKKPKPKPKVVIRDCQFVGVKFDGEAIEAVQTIAEALLENSKALLTVARVFSTSEVKIESMLKVNVPKKS